MSTAPGRRKMAGISPEGEHLGRVLHGCVCPECEEGRLRFEELSRRAVRRRRREAEALAFAWEGVALARRLLEATWDLEHAPQVWITWEGRGWTEPWRRAWARRRGAERERWVAEWVRRARLVRPPVAPVAMPDPPWVTARRRAGGGR